MLTLAEIAAAACEAVNLDDSPTIEVAKKFARRRWKLLWGEELWPSAVGVESVTPDALGRATLPEGVALVLQVSLADGTVIPPESEVARRLMASGTDGSDMPATWRECARTASGAPIISVLPPPPLDAALTVVVKRAAPALAADTDVPTLPGADLALIAHTTADLYEWQQQMTLAQTKRQEALALSRAMVDQAVNQAGALHRLVPWDGA